VTRHYSFVLPLKTCSVVWWLEAKAAFGISWVNLLLIFVNVGFNWMANTSCFKKDCKIFLEQYVFSAQVTVR